MKKILLIVGTHGNETEPIYAMERFKAKLGKKVFDKYFTRILANKKAIEKGVRFIDTDLNRIYPGNSKSKLLEEKLAASLLKKASKYQYVFDFHTTKSETGTFTIITKASKNNINLARKIGLKNNVIWESTSGRPTGPITSFLDNAIEIETSVNERNFEKQLDAVFENIYQALVLGKTLRKKQYFFRVEKSLEKSPRNSELKLNEFKSLKIGSENYYPLLIGAYKDKMCYLMEKII